MTAPVRLEARGLTVERGGRRVLDGVDLTVSSGEVVALVGPNGAGKSTLLAALAGDLRPAAGAALLDGHELGSLDAGARARARAVLEQDTTVVFPFTVRDVVAMGRAPHRGRSTRDEDDDAIDHAVARTGIASLLDRDVTTLSGGERARTALARVLAQTTGVLLLDEPTAALDPGHGARLLEVVGHEATAGAAVLVVLHDLVAAADHADRVVVLAEGRVVADGPPGEVHDAALLSQVYGSPMDVLEVDGRVVPLPRVTARRGA
jgi:iron complex transport system ATP-binding protein